MTYTWPYNVLADNRDRIKELEREVERLTPAATVSDEGTPLAPLERDRLIGMVCDLEQQLARVVERLTGIADRAEKTPHRNDPFFVALEIADELRAVLAEVQR